MIPNNRKNFIWIFTVTRSNIRVFCDIFVFYRFVNDIKKTSYALLLEKGIIDYFFIRILIILSCK